LDKGKLVCGVLGDENESMEVDYCRALSASLFASDSSLFEVVKLTDESNLAEKLDSGSVDVIVGAPVNIDVDISPLNETAKGFSGLAFSQPYIYYSESRDHLEHGSRPKALATGQKDADWSTFVYWVVANAIAAEENGITRGDFRDIPDVKFFGDEFEWMFRGPILAVGNYGEIYERHSENLPPRKNENLLNDGSSPQLWHQAF